MILTCPYCREEVNSNNQVLCDVCLTPHHYDCWKENGGCTVFGCARSPKDEEKITVSQQDLHEATEKKYLLNSDDMQTGPFSKSEITTMLNEGRIRSSAFVWGPEMTEWATLEQMSYKFNSGQSAIPVIQGFQSSETELIQIFVNNNYDYFQSKWMDSNKIGYNYAGFWVNMWWLAYRKMYGKWALAAVGYLCLGWFPFAGLFISYTIGKNANKWYLEHCRNKVREICPDGVLDEFRRQEIAKQGGTSWISTIGLNIITFTLMVVIYAAIRSK